jgi:hypothetical protein
MQISSIAARADCKLDPLLGSGVSRCGKCPS